VTTRVVNISIDPSFRKTKRINGLTEEERFWRMVRRDDLGCWERRGTGLPKGYKVFHARFPRANVLAHRYAWFITYGPIPDGMQVCHHCDNPSCCRPDHLFLGTNQDNTDDKRAKGRQPIGVMHYLRRLPKDAETTIADLVASGLSQRCIAQQWGVAQSTVSRLWKQVPH
jgi:hypothetical protein